LLTAPAPCFPGFRERPFAAPRTASHLRTQQTPWSVLQDGWRMAPFSPGAGKRQHPASPRRGLLGGGTGRAPGEGRAPRTAPALDARPAAPRRPRPRPARGGSGGDGHRRAGRGPHRNRRTTGWTTPPRAPPRLRGRPRSHDLCSREEMKHASCDAGSRPPSEGGGHGRSCEPARGGKPPAPALDAPPPSPRRGHGHARAAHTRW